MDRDNYTDNRTSGLGSILLKLYGPDAVRTQAERYGQAVKCFWRLFGKNRAMTAGEKVHIFRAPGRTEIGGNHTDHQHGQVLAAAIDKDILAVAAETTDTKIRIFSEGFGWTEVDLRPWILQSSHASSNPAGAVPEYDSTNADAGTVSVLPEKGTTAALIQGMVDGMKKAGYQIGGFCAFLTSNVPGGAGLSSSAAFETLIGTILNGMFNSGVASAEEIAHMAQRAENQYYGKPCGLMDQMACNMGGLCHMNFSNPAMPEIQKLDVDLTQLGYSICITDTHGSHADFTDDYAAVQTDLAAAAGVFWKSVLADVSLEEGGAHSKQIREAGGDRAFLRAMHVAAENQRVADEASALQRRDIAAFLDLVRESGDSSYKLLQNVHVDRMPERQELAVALAISEAFLKKSGGVCRVHGGGFAGTIQAFVPDEAEEAYRAAMDEAFGAGSCFVIRVCPYGGMQIA